MYTFKNVEINEINLFINGYYDTLTAPMDDMWEEGILPKSQYYKIDEKETIGFFAINDENILTQFYVVDLKHDKVFLDILKYFRITQAFVSSYDPVFYYVATKYKQATTVNALLYQESDYVTVENPIERLLVTPAKADEFEAVLAYHHDNNMSGEWLKPYLKKLIDQEALLLLKLDDQIIATGEFRVSKSSPHICNIGMTVALKHRRKGLGTFILNEVKNHCNYKGYETICGTDAENIASQKTILKSGFKCYHKIYNVWF